MAKKMRAVQIPKAKGPLEVVGPGGSGTQIRLGPSES
jgi:hypothetical protein